MCLVATETILPKQSMKPALRLSLSIALAILVFGGLFALFNSTARAATGLTIQPVKVSHTIQPGQSVSGVIRLTSASDGDPIQIESSVEDFIPIAGAEGIQFVGRAPGVTTVRDWISLGSERIFQLKQGDQIQIPYTITAPQNAEPGSHFGVAFFKATRPAQDGVEQLSIGTRIGMLILVTVPGNHLQKGKILNFSGPGFVQRPPVDFALKFENTGTVHFEPKGTLMLRNMFGHDVGQVPIEGQVVLPTGVRDINVRWNVKGWLLGYYNATATVFDGDGEALTTNTIGFWVVPVWYILGFILAVLIVFLVLRWFKRRVKISVSLK